MATESAEERITKVKVIIASSNPFFAYLSLYITIAEDKKNIIPKNAGMGVNANGFLLYKKSFVDGITDDQLKGVILHEILHLSLLHLSRSKKNKFKWNLASDIVVNNILLKNKYVLPIGALSPKFNEITILGKKIQKIDEKTAEDIYEELPEIQDEPSLAGKQFDNHENLNEKGGEQTESELQELETEWINRAGAAAALAEQKGSMPLGVERYLDKLKKVEIKWRILLRKFIQQSIPIDYSWQKRAKKSISLGVYLPGYRKDKVTIAVGIDTSGSIGDPELAKFLSEIIGIANIFREEVDMKIMFHDTEVQAEYDIKNGSVAQILKMMPRGGGGTSHENLLDKASLIKNCKCLISFTDGISDIEDLDLKKYKFPKLFIINKHGQIPRVNKGDAIFIKLKEE